MRIVDLLSKESIMLNGTPKTKSEAIDMLVDLQVKSGKIADKAEYKKGILAREQMSSTAVGEGIAIPHAKSTAVKAPSLAAMTVPSGVDYEALDEEPSNLLFMIAAPNDGDVHLEVLSRLMTILMDEDFRAKLIAAKNKDEFLKIIDDMEKEKYPDEPKEAVAESKTGYRVLAVTACPTGIAHTYMAAEALEKAGKKLGHPPSRRCRISASALYRKGGYIPMSHPPVYNAVHPKQAEGCRFPPLFPGSGTPVSDNPLP